MNSLLPPNATALERALEDVISRRITAITTPLRTLWSIADCPPALLPHLAWQIAVDEWDRLWGVARQRAVIDAALFVHRHRGTLGSIRRVLDAAGYPDADITEGVQNWRYGTEHKYGDPGLRYGTPYAWAKYEVIITQTITPAQRASITRLLEATAPARCKLILLTAYHAPWVYGDGSRYGSDLFYYGPEGS